MPQNFTLPTATSNAGPLISLESISGGFDLAKRLFSTIYIPEIVLSEIAYYSTPEKYLETYNISDFLTVLPDSKFPIQAKCLDPGEIQAITISLELLKNNPPPLMLFSKRGQYPFFWGITGDRVKLNLIGSSQNCNNLITGVSAAGPGRLFLAKSGSAHWMA